jgi:hypothetical protein
MLGFPFLILDAGFEWLVWGVGFLMVADIRDAAVLRFTAWCVLGGWGECGVSEGCGGWGLLEIRGCEKNET